jgi:hypothetical protein
MVAAGPRTSPARDVGPWRFAVGDARYRSIKRVASIVGDGATAMRLVHGYLSAEGAAEPFGGLADDQGGGTPFRLNGQPAGSLWDLRTGSIALHASRLIKIKAQKGSMCCMCRSWGAGNP